jgi:hypothetical protein
MCETSKSVIALRVARCSRAIDVYWTGINHPAKSTIRPPCAWCQANSGVLSGEAHIGDAERGVNCSRRADSSIPSDAADRSGPPPAVANPKMPRNALSLAWLLIERSSKLPVAKPSF